jgi:glycosyltransferase involved in cell wall biosynthesis
MKISVVTISQRGRFPTLQILVKHLLSQTIKPHEWVIVEGSKTEEDAALHAADIATIHVPFTVNYVPYKPGLKLGALRNRGNQACTGDITICMDDDDFYPTDRIQHVMEQFKKHPTLNIAGCTNVLLYDYTNKVFYQCIGFHPNHATNNTMAWRTKYIKTHRHDDEKSNAEEASFTNQFSEPMIPLTPTKTVIVSSHTSNTFDKRNLVKCNPRFIMIPHSAIHKLIPDDIYNEYSSFFVK